MNQVKQHQIINRKCRLCFYGSISLVLILTIIKMIMANSHSTKGSTLQEMENRIFQIQSENQKLKTEVALLSGGLDQIAKQAEEKGFIDNPTVKSFVKAPPLAQKMP